MAPSAREDSDPLAEALFKPEESTAPKNSMDMVLPPIRRSLPRKLMREIEERRRDLLFGNSETLANTLSPDQDSKTSDEPDKKLTPEEYYLKLARQQNSENSEKTEPGTKKTDSKEEDDRNLPPGLKERTSRLKALLGMDPQPEKETENANDLEMFRDKRNLSFSSFDPPPPPSREVIEARKMRMDEFRQMTGVPTIDLSPVEMFKKLTPTPDPLRASGSVGPSSAAVQLPAPAQDSSAYQLGSIPSLASVPDANRALALPSVAPATPSSGSAPVKLAPPTPNFTAPKRPF